MVDVFSLNIMVDISGPNRSNTNTNYYYKCTKIKHFRKRILHFYGIMLKTNKSRVCEVEGEESTIKQGSMPFSTARLTTGPWE